MEAELLPGWRRLPPLLHLYGGIMRARIWIPLWAILTVAALSAGYLVQLYQLLLGQDTGLTYADVFVALLAGAWWLRVSRRPINAAIACGLAALASMVVAGLLMPLTAQWLSGASLHVPWNTNLVGSLALGALALLLEAMAMGFMGAWLVARVAGVWPGSVPLAPGAAAPAPDADVPVDMADGEPSAPVTATAGVPAPAAQQSSLLDWLFPLFAALWAAPSGLALLPTLIPVTLAGARVTQPVWVPPLVQGLHVLALVVTAALAGAVVRRGIAPLAIARNALLGAGFGRLVVGADVIWRLYAPLFTTRGAQDFQDQGVSWQLAIAARSVEQIASTVVIALAAMGAALIGAWLFTTGRRLMAGFATIWPVPAPEAVALSSDAGLPPASGPALSGLDLPAYDEEGMAYEEDEAAEHAPDAVPGRPALRWALATLVFLAAIGVRLWLSPTVLHGTWPALDSLDITDAIEFILAGLLVALLADSMAAAISLGFLTGLILPGISIVASLPGLVQQGAFRSATPTALEIYILSIVVGLITLTSTFVSWYTIGGALVFGTPLRRFTRGAKQRAPAGDDERTPASISVPIEEGDPVPDHSAAED
jgi:hypothetical protein